MVVSVEDPEMEVILALDANTPSTTTTKWFQEDEAMEDEQEDETEPEVGGSAPLGAPAER